MPDTIEARSAVKVSEETTTLSPFAGKPAPKEMLLDVARLEREYFERHPDLQDRNQLVSFGTSGHRGSGEVLAHLKAAGIILRLLRTKL